MKLINIHLIAASFGLLMSMSECDLDYKVSAPVTAEINGKLFSSDGYRHFSEKPSFLSSSTFILPRELYSVDGDYANITLHVELEIHEEIKIDSTYHSFSTINAHRGRDGFVKILNIDNERNRVEGEFGFIVIDQETGDTTYIVKNGKFLVPG